MIFDVNRSTDFEPLLVTDPLDWLLQVLKEPEPDHALTLITNHGTNDERVVSRHAAPCGTTATSR